MRAAVLVGIVMLLPALAAPPKHVRRLPPDLGKATLGYPGPATAVVKTKDGATYRLRLDALPNVHGTITDLVLVVQRADAGADAPNLIDPPGNWHGYQPYTFAATDFKAGPEHSLFGGTRSVCRFNSGIRVGIVVKEAAVGMVAESTERRFKALVLDVALEQTAVVDGHPVCN
jgi:hypothetical protein